MTFVEKVKLLDRLESGARVTVLAKDYNINESTICYICQYRDKIRLDQHNISPQRWEHNIIDVRDLWVAPGRSIGYLRAVTVQAELTGATHQQHSKQ